MSEMGLSDDLPEDEITCTAMYLEDIFCGNKFVVVKIVNESSVSSRMGSTEFHVRKVLKPAKVAKSSLFRHGDERDAGYAITLESRHERPFEVKGGAGMLYLYGKFEEAFRTLYAISLELKESES
jgi:hypothetical protein